MKKIAVGLFLASVLILGGCGKSSATGGTAVNNKLDSASLNQSTINSLSGSKNGSNQSKATSGKVPALTTAEKTKVNDTVSSAVSTLNDVLNSVQEAKDVDLSGM